MLTVPADVPAASLFPDVFHRRRVTGFFNFIDSFGASDVDEISQRDTNPEPSAAAKTEETLGDHLTSKTASP